MSQWGPRMLACGVEFVPLLKTEPWRPYTEASEVLALVVLSSPGWHKRPPVAVQECAGRSLAELRQVVALENGGREIGPALTSLGVPA